MMLRFAFMIGAYEGAWQLAFEQTSWGHTTDDWPLAKLVVGLEACGF